jgi:hypothetical protein
MTGLSLTALVGIAIARGDYGVIYGKREIGECGYIDESIFVTPTFLIVSDNLQKRGYGSYLE